MPSERWMHGCVVVLTLLGACRREASKPAQVATYLRIDLLALRDSKTAPRLRTAHIAEVPVYRSSRRLVGYPLREVLRRIPAWQRHERAEAAQQETAELLFRCRDGYRLSMPLRVALQHRGLLALRDADAPEGQDWLPFQHGKSKQTPAPFYLVWEDEWPEAHRYTPYQVTAIEIVDAAAEYRAALPPDDAPREAMLGFELFRQQCIKCHSINLVGGKLGPELNSPRNILEYWREEDVRGFVVAPQSYRAGSSMPPHSQLSNEQLDQLIAYLRSMQGRRLP